jgi:hypothetical protein
MLKRPQETRPNQRVSASGHGFPRDGRSGRVQDSRTLGTLTGELPVRGNRACFDFCAKGTRLNVNSVKGDSPIFSDTQTGTVPGNILAVAKPRTMTTWMRKATRMLHRARFDCRPSYVFFQVRCCRGRDVPVYRCSSHALRSIGTPPASLWPLSAVAFAGRHGLPAGTSASVDKDV